MGVLKQHRAAPALAWNLTVLPYTHDSVAATAGKGASCGQKGCGDQIMEIMKLQPGGLLSHHPATMPGAKHGLYGLPASECIPAANMPLLLLPRWDAAAVMLVLRKAAAVSRLN